ncbi:MAG: hypothetical protein WAM60_14005 [Candidatus Promineifilaceae bacterium]
MKTHTKSVLFAIALVMFLALAMTAFLGLSGSVDVAGSNIPKPFAGDKTIARTNNHNNSNASSQDGYAIAGGSVIPRP